MALINKNIWLAFYLVTIVWSVSLGLSCYSTYQRVYNEFISEQMSLTTMAKNSLQAAFKQYETILNIVASQLIKENQLTDQQAIKSLMEGTTNLDSTISGFALFNLDGTVHTSVPESTVAKEASLLSIQASQASFHNTLNSDSMIIGRTYFSHQLNELIIPFRLAIRDASGRASFVLSLAVSLDKGFDFFVHNANESGLYNTYLYRDTDRYFQLAPLDKIHDTNIYQYQISQSDIDKAIKHLATIIDTPYAQLKQDEVVIVNENKHPARQSLDASVYMKDYKLWLVTAVKFEQIQQNFIDKVSVLIAVHFFSIILIYLLFKNIAASEKKKTRELAFQANHDYLTHLYNRFYFDSYLASIKNNIEFSLIYLDIDHFKSINDSFGHLIGDQLLKSIATKINSIAAKEDLVIRANSDEFVLITFNKSRQQTEVICERLRITLDKPIRINEAEIMLSVSIGVSFYPQDSDNPQEIKRNADLAMDNAKKERNCTVFFNQVLLNAYLEQCNIENELKRALANQEFFMLYQPQVTASGKLVGVEALIRWKNEKLGMMPPDKFIPIAESLGMMDKIGNFVIERSLSDMSILQKRITIPFSLSINASVKQFNNIHFFKQLMQRIEQFDFATERLIIEVTESVLIEDVDSIKDLMKNLKEQGIRLSLDDFGTGYSSLSLLNNLPIDELKIDKSFVDNVINDKDTRAMINTIISLAKNKKMKTVAEGVECKEMLQALDKLDCDIYQGYYFSKPIDKHQLEQFALQHQNDI
ncbi:bifunctional diguanylate cyclase/phosphodiesterase [Psychromonas sp. psych-6C06]|uniref:bifunctional diguanylate cyclase/phosphodiesterase n=1 Tax=Psychromonas sp. psych-6C06 TaxID=2058089 RepID=UPI000C34C052|nr:EAL domain-containing protein [Psychromonas sp. psych-6C06]PKF61620.1 bifunctional diguanylate cyclase/phosphodiesterase [Psychromonas sp. psych-6C06]